MGLWNYLLGENEDVVICELKKLNSCMENVIESILRENYPLSKSCYVVLENTSYKKGEYGGIRYEGDFRLICKDKEVKGFFISGGSYIDASYELGGKTIERELVEFGPHGIDIMVPDRKTLWEFKKLAFGKKAYRRIKRHLKR